MESKHLYLHPPRLVVAGLVVLLLTGTALTGMKAYNEWKSSRFIGMEATQPSTLTVVGRGRVMAKPDVAEMSLNVSLRGLNLAAIQAENTAKTNAIITYLKSLKIEEKDIQTGAYSINPEWDYTDQGRVFRGFSIHNGLRVNVRDFNQIGTILEQAVQLGANDVNFAFTLENQEALQAKARDQAIENAKADARALADQLGVRLVKINSFSEGAADRQPQPLLMNAPAMEKAADTPMVQPGENALQAEVMLVYEIN